MTARLLVGPSSVSQHRSGRRGVYDRRRMDLDLTHEQELIRDTVRSFARERIAPVAEELDRESRFPVQLVREMAALGLMGIPIPERHGGAGGDTVSYAVAVEELTRIDSSVAITVAAHTSLGTMPIFLFGSDEQKDRWLPDLASGRKIWEVPLGTMAPDKATGSPNLGGPIVTASGLAFIGATIEPAIRAFDIDTGKLLWRAELPGGARATPMTYRAGGRQYVVIAAGGGDGFAEGDAIVAFALPELPAAR